jgi:bis(5'-nucleosidyl)-tetraphosphatase
LISIAFQKSPVFEEMSTREKNLMIVKGYYLKKITGCRAFVLLLSVILLTAGKSFGQEQREMKKTICAGGIIFHPLFPDQLAIVMGKKGTWSLPKGHVEKGETVLEGAKREIYEETGLTDLVFDRELGSYERIIHKKNGNDEYDEIKVIHIFLFHTESTQLRPVDPANPEAKWANVEECLQLLKHDTDKEFLLKNVCPLIPIKVKNR